jgi:predicted aspartyl protease
MRRACWWHAAFLSVTGIFGIAAASPVEPGASSLGLRCRIEVDHAGGMLRLQALGRSEAAVFGRYRFSIEKQSAAGASANQQSGDFALAPGEEKILATVMLDSGAEGHFSARLTINSATGSAVCQAP